MKNLKFPYINANYFLNIFSNSRSSPAESPTYFTTIFPSGSIKILVGIAEISYISLSCFWISGPRGVYLAGKVIPI